MQSNVYVAIKPPTSLDDDLNLNLDIPDEYDFLLSPITNSRYKFKIKSLLKNFNNNTNTNNTHITIPEPQLQDISITPFSNNRAYIGLLSSWLDLENENPIIRQIGFKVLLNELKYAKFIGIKNVILAPPKDLSNLHYYTQIIIKLLNSSIIIDSDIILSISLPLCEDTDPLATWELWNSIRKFSNYNKSLTISLALPRFKTPNFVIKRWLSEPVSSLLLSSSIFSKNNHNYPVLHKFNQNIILQFQKINANNLLSDNNNFIIILHGTEKYSNNFKGGQSSYLDYINFLLRKGDRLLLLNNDSNNIEKTSTTSTTTNNSTTLFESNNNNNTLSNTPALIKPLKPHSEMLLNSTYSTFENDSIKYKLYENAIHLALLDIIKSFDYNNNKFINILILGAGRGPLIEKTFNLLQNLNFLNFTNITAIEKNSNAFLYLQNKNYNIWQKKINIFNTDIKNWSHNNIKFDLCISELLGSFGCNELSPECLSIVENNYSKHSTIFIPKSYTSYIAPISSPILYQKLSQLTSSSPNPNTTDYFQTPWILHNIPYTIISSKINEFWSFSHPNINNSFSKDTYSDFKIKHRSDIHGFIGFFTAILFNDIVLSTIPDDSLVKLKSTSIDNNNHLISSSITSLDDNNNRIKKINHTPNLHSWSPFVFPIKSPIYLSDDSELSIFLSRIHSFDNNQIWYEWSAETFVYIIVQQQIKSKKINKEKDNRNTNHHNNNNNISHNTNTSTDNEIVDDHFIKDETIWQSVNDIHNLATSNGPSNMKLPAFNLENHVNNMKNLSLKNNNNHHNDIDTDLEETREVHMRIRTGITPLHNVNGTHFHIPF